MFRLKRLELLGFKSFADRTRLEFGPGTVGVVGPNGCGKSNLADAINWVLGEQSARLLRGERMTDVIFNGTGNRLPTGMVEVSLTLEDPEYVNVDGAVAARPSDSPGNDWPRAERISVAQPLGDAEPENQPPASPGKRYEGTITVTRRLFRSGESEYLINGEPSRLRDIQDLFMGTGLGPESYAIIEQGRIGQILSSRPSDRRLILEEAAGISKFKARKRAAELKLESSRQNLARIADILEEVTKQLNALRRQAGKARRFRELQDQLTGRLKVTLASRLKVLEDICAERRKEFAALDAAFENVARLLEQIEKERKAAAIQDEELESQLTELRQLAMRAELDQQRIESRIEKTRERSASLESRIQDAASETQRFQERHQTLESEARRVAERVESLEIERTAARNETLRLSAAQGELGQKIRQTEQALETSRSGLLEAMDQAASLRNQLVQLEESDLGMERRLSRLTAERADAEAEHNQLAAEIELLRSECGNREAELSSLNERLAKVSAESSEARRCAADLEAHLDDLRQEQSAAAARKQALEESLSRHATARDSVRRLLTGEIKPNGHRFRPLGVLSDFMDVASGYEEVVEEFLDAHLDCVVVEDSEEARSGIALLRQAGAGRSTFLVTRFPSNGNGHSPTPESDRVRSEPGVVASMRELIRFAPQLELNGDLPLSSLAAAYVVEDARAAERLAVAYPACHFLTSEGEHYHYRLVSGGRGHNAGPLALRRDLRELERRVVGLASNLEALVNQHAEAETRVAALSQELENLTGTKLEAEKALALLREKNRSAEDALNHVEERQRLFDGESNALVGEREAMKSRHEALLGALAAASAEKARQEELSNMRNKELRELRATFDRATQELARAQAVTSALEERSQSLEGERQRLDIEIRESTERAAQLDLQIRSWQAEQASLLSDIEASEAQRTIMAGERQHVEERVRELTVEARQARTRRDECSLRVDQGRAQLEAYHAKRSESEVALARAESDRDHHVALCRETLREDPQALLTALDPSQALTGEVLESAENEVRELRTRIENLGPLNMMALEELKEAEERDAFLETQRQDLLTSIEETTLAIREIDRVSRQQLLEAFKAINTNFAEAFRTLFGGGVGQMRLADEDDPESGIEVVAQPPGKRLQNVLLLSGGEKALTALALLIAIFRYTPSPFCVLDEVDAPLDESNVDRFTRLIRDMSRQTQFILITHNKRTMEIADTLYGVTMEEPGVSKLVSVRFENAVAA